MVKYSCLSTKDQFQFEHCKMANIIIVYRLLLLFTPINK